MSIKEQAREVTLNETLSYSIIIVIFRRYNMKKKFKNLSMFMFFMLILKEKSLLLKHLHTNKNWQKLIVQARNIQILPPKRIV